MGLSSIHVYIYMSFDSEILISLAITEVDNTKTRRLLLINYSIIFRVVFLPEIPSYVHQSDHDEHDPETQSREVR